MPATVILQDDVDGLPVMPVALYHEGLMDAPGLAEYVAGDDGSGVEVEITDPRWVLTARASDLDYDDYMTLKGWVYRVRTVHAGRFLGFDPRTRRPRAYPQDIVPPAPVLALALPRDPPRTVPLAGLPAGYRLSAGDRLGYVSSTGVRCAHEIVSDVAASPQGTAVLSVVPRVLLPAAAGTPVTLDRPLQLFHLVPGSVEHSLAMLGEIAFRAVSINRVLAPL